MLTILNLLYLTRMAHYGLNLPQVDLIDEISGLIACV